MKRAARDKRLPRGVEYEPAKLHYDTASMGDTGALSALTTIAPVSQILFGSDYPFPPSSDPIEGLPPTSRRMTCLQSKQETRFDCSGD